MQTQPDGTIHLNAEAKAPWGSKSHSVFFLHIGSGLGGEYQLTNAYGDRAGEVLRVRTTNQ